jgi:hypothetical protein
VILLLPLFVVPTAVGVLIYAYLWRKKRLTPQGTTLLIGVVIACTVLGTFCPGMYWDGGYGQDEFQLTFLDQTGKPVPGVQLRVEDRDGRNYFHYPVSDYLPDRPVASDDAGLMVFHHVQTSGVEFSGHTTFLYGLIPVVRIPGPKFVCRFLYREREVWRIDYSELAHPEGPQNSAKVKRSWKWSAWPMTELLRKPGEDWTPSRERMAHLFGTVDKTKLTPEADAAYRAATCPAMVEAADAQRNGKPMVEDLEFYLIRRMVMVSLAGH